MTLTLRVVHDIAELAAVKDEWTALLGRSAANAPMLTPTWLLPWWKTFGTIGDRALAAVLLSDGGRLVGLAPLLSRPSRSRLGIPFRRIELLGSGEHETEEISSEYIGIVAERGAEEAVAEGVAGALVAKALGPWDELSLAAMSGDSALPAVLATALAKHGIVAHTELTGVAYHIRLPKSWDDYLAALPSARRYWIRRTLRDFERWAGGDMRIERADTPDDLARGLGILEALHAARWQQQGGPGAFASPRFHAFHAAVMPELLQEHALELVWITVKDRPIAAAYNLVWDRKVQFYQSGRAIDVPRGVRPGIVLHVHSIRAAIEAGCLEYDFLSGDARYKAELALDARPLVHLRATRPSVADAARRATELAIDQLRAFRALREAQRRLTATATDVTGRRAPATP